MCEFEKGIAVISVDDGSADNYRLYRLLKEYGIPATFNIVTARIGEEGYLTLEQLREIHNDPLMEIACHGHTHKNSDEDILLGNKHLFEWLGEGDGKIGFASPGSDMKQDFVAQNEAHLREMGLLYVRSATNFKPSPRHLELMEALKAQNAAEKVLRNVSQLIYRFDGMFIPSAVVHNYTLPEDLMSLADLAATERACLVFMLHRVKKQGEPAWDNTWSYDLDKTEAFLKYLKQMQDRGELTLLTTRAAYEKYSR